MKSFAAFLSVILLTLCTPLFAQDAIPRTQLLAVGPGSQSMDFPVTTAITRVTFNAGSMEVEFTKKDSWPSGVTPGFDGPLQYSIGFVLKVNDFWYASAPIENWHGRSGSTGPVQDQSVTNPANPACMGQFQCNIFYDGRWDPLQTRRPSPGESIGVYVVSGDARNDTFVTGVRERSNIVLVQLPAPGQTAVFDFDGGVVPGPVPVPTPTPSPTPSPAPAPQPVPAPPPGPAVDYSVLLSRVIDLQVQQLALQQHVSDAIVEIQKDTRTFTQQFGTVMKWLGEHGLPVVLAWLAARKM